MNRALVALSGPVLLTGCAAGLNLDRFELIDLTHAYNERTLYWPTATQRFELTEEAYGEVQGGWFYASYRLSTPEHGGTHLDAPIHFAAGALTTDALPLRQLVTRAVVIDVSAKAARDRNYLASADDVLAFERRHGRIYAGTAVLLHTGWDSRWPDALAYLGDDTPGDASNLSFPSFGADAARLLVEDRGVLLLGVDTASIDGGRSTDFQVHRIAAARNVAGLENLTGLQRLPPTGATLVALPMKIEDGSGGPVRVVALVPHGR